MPGTASNGDPRVAIGQAPAQNGAVDPELIDPSVLQDRDDDRFGYADVVDELKELVKAIEPPSNVALFAPWGSGKTSVAHLLEQGLRTEVAPAGEKSPTIRFAYFDAFKFNELSLRRDFVKTLGGELGVPKRKLDTDLYASRTWTEFVPPGSDMPRLLLYWLGAITMLAAIGLALAVLAAALSAGPFASAFSAIVDNYVLAVLLAPAIVAGFITLAGKGVSAEHSRAAPEAADDFERLFRGLMEEVKADKVVIFVDELDRCAGDEVVGTLDALRTFLEEERCIFIVAADRQVLEHALTRSLRQATPENAGNPYYSAGNSFIDKLFHYQLELPPLRTARVHAYAHGLIAGRKGIWQRFSDDWYVLSVLIPPHVKSPRRIKVLLNSFALTYRLLAKREKQVARIDERAAEIAKLVCLRCEFPLFAADLYLDPELPRLVLQADEDAASLEADDIEEDRRHRAKAYATGELPAAQLLVEADQGDARAKQEASTAVTAVRRQHSLQLIRYLKETKDVPDPARDLIHAQGLDSNLPSEIVEELVRVALDGDEVGLTRVLEKVGRRARDGSVDQHAWRRAHRDERDAVGVLAQTVRREDPKQRRRVIRALLAATEACAPSLEEKTPDGAAEEMTERVASALLLHVSGLVEDLETHERLPLLRLGLATGRDVFIRCALEQAKALEDSKFRRVALSRVSGLLPAWAEHAGTMWAAALAGDDEIAIECLTGRASRQTEATVPERDSLVAGPAEPAIPRLSAQNTVTLLAHALGPAQSLVGEPPPGLNYEPVRLKRMQGALIGIVDELEGDPAEAAALILFSITSPYAPDCLVDGPVSKILMDLAPLRYQPLANAVAAAAGEQPLERWPRVFGLLDAESFKPAEDRSAEWRTLIVKLHTHAQGASESDPSSTVENAISALPSRLACAIAHSSDVSPMSVGLAGGEEAREAEARLSLLSRLCPPASWDRFLRWWLKGGFERTASRGRVDDPEEVAAYLEKLMARLLEAEDGRSWERARSAVEDSSWLPQAYASGFYPYCPVNPWRGRHEAADSPGRGSRQRARSPRWSGWPKRVHRVGAPAGARRRAALGADCRRRRLAPGDWT